MTALFAGLTTLDVLHRLDHVPDPSLKVTSTDFTMAAGGPATNAAVTYAALCAASRALSAPDDEAEAASGGKRAYDLSLDGHAPRGRDVAWALASLRAPELWDAALTRASDVREERHYVPGSPDPELLILHQGGGLGRSVPVSSAVSAVVGASDGELTVGQIVAAVAMLTSAEVDDVRAEVEAPLRDLIRWGFLTY